MQVAAPPARPASSPHTSAATTQQSFSTARAMRFDRVLVRHRRVTSAGRSLFRPDLLGLINDLFAQPVPVWMLGALMLGAGLVIIGGHRNWRGPLAVTVSLFGWFVALRGFLLIANPTAIQSGVDATMLSPTARLWPASSSAPWPWPACCSHTPAGSPTRPSRIHRHPRPRCAPPAARRAISPSALTMNVHRVGDTPVSVHRARGC